MVCPFLPIFDGEMGGDVIFWEGLGRPRTAREKNADDVAAGLELLAEVGMEGGGVTAGALAGGFTVDEEGDESGGGGVGGGGFDFGAGREVHDDAGRGGLLLRCAAINPGGVGKRGGHDVIAREIRGDPFAFPFLLRVEETEFDGGGLAPVGGLVGFVPCADLPKDEGAGVERLARPRDEDGLIGDDFAGGPEIGRGGEFVGRGGGADFVGGLDVTGAIGLGLP